MRKSEIHAAESVSCLNKALCHLRDIWEEIGIPEDQRLQRTDAVHMHIKNLLDMMIAEEEGLKKRLLTSIEACRKEVSSLCDELQVQDSQEEDNALTMLQLEKDLRTQVKMMLKEKSSRQSELKALIQQDQDLCDVLCDDLFPIHPERVPSEEQLQNYRRHINARNQEKERRHAEFVEMKRQITVLMEDLEQNPDTTFEKDAVCEDEDAFCLSVENISSLKVLLQQLETRKAESEALCVSVRCRIEELWEMLQIPLEERESLMHDTHTSTKRVLNALQAELQRLEELKKKNIERVIHTVRSEIARFWDKCYYSLEQRHAFIPFHSEDLNEDVLRDHEQELERLKQDYTEHRELYDAVSTWSNNWTLYQELEKKATDPSRFNNRGGNLLKEEKQRIDLQKSLPKLEKSLKAQIDQWEEVRCKEFRVNGQPFLQYVEDQWNQHRMQKEIEKQERQMKKMKQTEEDLLYGTVIRTPTKRRLAGTPTPGKTRKMNSTSSICSSTPNTTLRSICSSPSMRPPLSTSKLGARTPARGRTPRGLERNKENICHLSGALRTMAASPHRNYSITSVASSYSEFARDSESTAASSGSSQTLLNPTSRLEF